jgi:hypothetical protein
MADCHFVTVKRADCHFGKSKPKLGLARLAGARASPSLARGHKSKPKGKGRARAWLGLAWLVRGESSAWGLECFQGQAKSLQGQGQASPREYKGTRARACCGKESCSTSTSPSTRGQEQGHLLGLLFSGVTCLGLGLECLTREQEQGLDQRARASTSSACKLIGLSSCKRTSRKKEGTR